MGVHLFTKPLATGLVLALSSVCAAQTVSAVSQGSLRPSWSDSAMAEGCRAIRVSNTCRRFTFNPSTISSPAR